MLIFIYLFTYVYTYIINIIKPFDLLCYKTLILNFNGLLS